MTVRVPAVVAVVGAWLVTRAVVVWLLEGRHDWVAGDLAYFAASLAAVPDVGLDRTLVEYPLPAVLVVAVPWLLVVGAGAEGMYPDAVLALSLAADAAFTVLLARQGSPGRSAGLAVWILAVPLLGATTYARFDLVPGLLAGVSVLVLARQPRVAAGVAAVATGLKLWPVLVLPALAARRSTRGRVLAVVTATGALLVAVSLAVAGWGRLLSPLTWQADRGLQIESVAATPAMVAWVLRPDDYAIAYSEHNAFEVTGPGTGLLLQAADLAPLLVLPGLLALWLVAFRRRGDLAVDTVAWTALGAVTLLLATSKVLSPQYLLWLLPLAAACVAAAGCGHGLRAWSVVLLAATALTQLVFPELYVHLTDAGAQTGRAVLALAARNVLVVALTTWALVAAWRRVSEEGRSSASRPGRGGTTLAPSGGGRPTPT